MAALNSTDRRRMWFGTEESMRWIQTPLSGAEMGAEGTHSEATLLSGGGFAQHSWGSHKVYDFEWPDTSARQAAQTMKSYRDGTFGRGLIYFVDPMIYDLNVLPARWADPSMAIGDEGATLVYGVYPTATPTTGHAVNDLPVYSAQYDLTDVNVGYRGIEDSLFIPIPEGFRLMLGAIYAATGNSGVYVSEVTDTGTGDPIRLSPLTSDSTYIVNSSVTGVKGVRLWVGKTEAGTATVTLTALTARLVPGTTGSSMAPGSGTVYGYGTEPYGTGPYGGLSGGDTAASVLRGPWVGGMGHSGCRFTAVPTYVANSGVGGGQVGYAVTLREVGSWIYG